MGSSAQHGHSGASKKRIGFSLARMDVPSPGATTSWKFTELRAGKLCSDSICCSALVTAGRTSGYVLAVLDGNDTEEGVTPFPAQVCAVLPCSSASEDCLTHQAPQGDLQGVQLIMTGVTAASVVPEVFADDETLLTPGNSTDGFDFFHSGLTAS